MPRPRFLVERALRDGLHVPMDTGGAEACLSAVATNADPMVTRVQTYVTEDKGTTSCIYDGPNVEAIRKAGERNGLPVDRIRQVLVLDPYFDH